MMKKVIVIIMAVIFMAYCFSGCVQFTREADKVNHNMSRAFVKENCND